MKNVISFDGFGVSINKKTNEWTIDACFYYKTCDLDEEKIRIKIENRDSFQFIKLYVYNCDGEYKTFPNEYFCYNFPTKEFFGDIPGISSYICTLLKEHNLFPFDEVCFVF